MKIFMRVIGFGLLGYALMLTQANPAQGTAFYLRSTWGGYAVLAFTIWFIGSGFFLLLLSLSKIQNLLAWFFAGVLPQIAYTFVALLYVIFDGLINRGNSQWGAVTTHGFGSALLLAIIYLYHAGRIHDPQ
jgi:hypothetical protein